MPETAVQTPALVPQKHGGRLLTAGKKGNRGGGRTPDKLRAALRAVGQKGVKSVLEPLIRGDKVEVISYAGSGDSRRAEVIEVDPDPAVRVKAVDVALKYGLGTEQKVEVEHHGEIVHKPYIELPPLGQQIALQAPSQELPELVIEAPE